MSAAWRNLGGKRRTLARLVYERDSNCHVCKRWVDQSLQWPHPMSRSVDHVHETQDGGPLLDLDNLVMAHLRCNSSKGSKRRHERTRESRRETSTIIIDSATL